MKNTRRKLLFRQPMYDFLKSVGKLPQLDTSVPDIYIKKAVRSVSKFRPIPNELIDQCPITDNDLFRRAKLVCKYLQPIKNKKILFIGDDDLTSAVVGQINYVNLSVIEIDKKILSVIKKFTDNRSVSLANSNVFDIVEGKTKDPFNDKFDAFVTDPPYTEMGYKYFLSYGVKHLDIGGLAFIAIPYMNKEDWSAELLFKIEDFLIQNGFVIIEVIPGFAQYQHKDKVLSSMLVANKVAISKQCKIEFKRTKAYTTGFEL